ncbi:MAG: GMC family oxidoreductase [Alphaproteobacteria bacterium]|nr:GMC family oxidoreductase [Alphaproteobacteria bacterium]MCB9792658.1 GMC family oxidoreductase [Alphaproteobacteria bacterium]
MIDGSALPVELEADAVVVGSGAGGASCARWLAAAGRRVILVEEGPPARPAETALEAFATLYRDGGATTTLGLEPMPLLQGRCVGGTTVVNGAIQVPLPRDVWEAWPASFRALAPWEALQAAQERMDGELHVAPTPEALRGPGALLARAFPEAGPIHRNAPGCQGSGRCLLGCPNRGEAGRPLGKASLDLTMIPRAVADGAQVVARCEVRRVRIRGGRVQGVEGRFEGGARFVARAPLVVVAAGAIHSPRLLARSGVRGVGRGFMAHPGAAVAGLFPEPLGPGGTQTMELLSERERGYKLETVHLSGALQALKVPGVGARFAARLAQSERVATWAVACRAEARGRVLPGPTVLYAPTRRDRAVLLAGLARAAEGMLRAGALEVWPGVHGAPEVITRVEEARALAELSPDRGRVPMLATHLFGGVPVGPRFQVGGVQGLVAADASILPSNLGVNPMRTITATALLVAEAWG